MLQQTNYKIKCDVFNCNNEASYYFAIKGRNRQLNLCNECLAKLNAVTAKVTKSPENAISKRLRGATATTEQLIVENE